MSTACPQCDKDDAVQKVSVLVLGGNSSALAQKLREPSKPREQGVSQFWYIIPCIPLLAGIVIWFAPMSKKVRPWFFALFILLFVFMFVGTILASTFHLPVQFFSILGGVILVIGFIILLALYYIGITSENKHRIEYYNSVMLPQYQQDFVKWNNLYYCHRDGSVFDPMSRTFTSVDRMEDLFK